MRCANILPSRSTTPTVLLPNPATNSRRRGSAVEMWPIRPATLPSGILASSASGVVSPGRSCPTDAPMAHGAKDAQAMRRLNQDTIGAMLTHRTSVSFPSKPPNGLRSSVRTDGRGIPRLVQSGTESLRQFQRIVICPEMQEEQSRLFVQHVAVHGGDLDAVGLQRVDDWVYFAADQHEISRDRRLSVASRLKVDSRRDAEWPRRIELHSLLGDLVAPLHGDLVDASRGLSFGADDLVDLPRVEIHG